MNGKQQLSKKLVFAVALGLVALTPLYASAANKLIVKDAAGTVDKFVVTDTGRIGINASAPVAGITIESTSANDTKVQAHLTTATSYDAPNLSFLRSNPNGGTSQLPLSNDRLGYVLFGGIYGSTARNAVGVFGYAGANWSDATSADWSPAYLTFETTDLGSKTRLERVRISTDGKVGIGTTSPQQKLEVNGAIRLNPTTNPSPALACNSTTNRGTIQIIKGGTSVADVVSVCTKDASENYAWHPLF